MSFVVRSLLLLALAQAMACAGCGPTKAGDPCDDGAEDDPCPDGLVCQDDGDEVLCRVTVGGTCDADADEAFCASGTSCTGEDEDAVCGGIHSTCRLDVDDACANGFACEEVDGQPHEAQCEKPVTLTGRVIDAQTEDGTGGAHIIAPDEQAAALSRIARSASDGAYSLAVPAKRNANGAPLDRIITLRSSAQDYQTFPGGLRTALPVHLNEAEEGDDTWELSNAITVIGLLELPDAMQGRAVVEGTVLAGGASGGVLVVAHGAEVATAVSDRDGDFTIFNVASGSYELRGYAQGVQIDPATVDVGDDNVDGVELRAADGQPVTMTGSVQIVNAPGGSETSIVLVVNDTFDDVFLRGESPRGLRTPLNVSGDWTIEGVPDGEYVVLAGFENDGLVRDPDDSIGGTELVRITVSGGQAVDVQQSFKVTEALAIRSPGADQAEAVTGTPTFVFEDDSSEDGYDVQVFDAFGELVWETTVASVSGSDDVSVVYGGPALEAGMYYQFRARSVKDGSIISTTEDLRGVFFVPASGG